MDNYINRNVTVLDWVRTPEPIKTLLRKYVVEAGDMGQNSFTYWAPIDLEISREDAIEDPAYAYNVKEYGVEIFPTREEIKILEDWWLENNLDEDCLLTVWW